ncbi:MAG: AsmA-like C-terminal region-containing protein [Burkholderiaceae bacterium]
MTDPEDVGASVPDDRITAEVAKPARRRWLAVPLALALLLLLALFGSLGWLAGPGVTVDGDGLRARVEALAGDALDRPVRIAGAMRLHLSMSPWVEVSELHIGAQAAPATPGIVETARLRRARLALELLPLLRERQLSVRKLEAEGLLLERRGLGPDATANSGPADARRNGPVPAEGPAANEHAASGWLPRRFGVDALEMRDVVLRLVNPDGSEHRIDLDLVQGAAPAGQPLSVRADVSLDARARVGVVLEAASIDALVNGSRPWPMKLRATAYESSITMDGEIDAPATGQGRTLTGRFLFGFGTPDPSALSAALARDLPPLGPTAFAARMRVLPTQMVLDEITGIMGESRLGGNLRFDFGRAQARVSGALSMSRLDLRPFLGLSPTPAAASSARQAQASASGKPPAAEQTPTLAQWYRELSRARIELGAMRSLDLDVDLSVSRWLGIPGDVRDARIALRLVDGVLKAPMGVNAAGVRLDGELIVDTRASVPSAELTVGAAETDLGDVARLVAGITGLRGHVGGIALRMLAEGNDAPALARSLDVTFVVARGDLRYRAEPQSRPIPLGFDSLVLKVPAGAALSASGAGSLLEQPIELAFTAGTLDQMLRDGRTPLALRLRSRSARVEIDGSIGQIGAGARPDAFHTDLSIAVRAARSRDLSRWLGLRANLDARFEASAHLLARGASSWAVRDGRVALGVSRLWADIAQEPVQGRPRIRARLRAETLDVDELEALLTRVGQVDAPTPDADGIEASFDIPILPARLDLDDIDLTLDVARIRRSELDLRDLSFATRMRGGRIDASPMRMRVLGVPLAGALELDLRGAEPHGQWWLMAENVDVGSLLRRLQLSDRIDGRVDSLQVHLSARGRRLGEMLDRSSASIQVEGGELALRDPGSGRQARVRVATGLAIAAPGEALRGAISGAIGDEPVAFALSSGRLRQLVSRTQPVPLHIDANLAGAVIALDGRLDRSRREPSLRLSLHAEGDRLADWDRLAGVALPAWGPYRLEGRLNLSGDGYALDSLQLAIGESRLGGHGTLDMRARPPRLSLEFAAPSVRIDDFRLGRWDPFGRRRESVASAPASVETIRAQARAAGKELRQILGPDVLAAVDAAVDIRVDDVRAGQDRLGRGRLRLSVQDGQARIGPLEVSLPRGRANAELRYAPGETDIDIRARLKLDDVDYGLLARQARTGTDLAGRISLDMDVSARAPSLDRLMARGDGHLSFRAWPENLRADVFDLWAANLFVSLANRLDPQNDSRVNCVAAEFALDGGRLEARRMLLDTTKVRVLGNGHVDFRDETLALRLIPRPKRAEFFSLATPLDVGGPLADPVIGPRAGDLFATGVRLVTSLIWVPLLKAVGQAPPADGTDVCSGVSASLPAGVGLARDPKESESTESLQSWEEPVGG